MFLIVGLLDPPSSLGLNDRGAHGIRYVIRIHNNVAF